MKFVVHKEKLLPVLVNAARFSQGKTISSISLQGLLLLVKGDVLFIKSTNLNDFYEAKIISTSKKDNIDGKVVIDGRMFIEYVSNIPDEELILEKDTNTLNVKFSKSEGVFPLLSDEEFIEYPSTEGESEKLDLKDVDKLQSVIFSTSKDDSRPVLMGVRIDELGGDQCLVSTDGYRLSITKLQVKQKLSQITIPASFANELLRAKKTDPSTMVFVNNTTNIVFFENESEKLISRLLIGEYPPFARVIPTDKAMKVVVDRQEWLRAVKLTAVFAKDGSNVITLNFSKDGVKIYPKTQGSGGSVAHVDVSEFEGEERSVSFNSRYLVEFLLSSKEDEVIFEIMESTSPAVFRFPKNPDYTHIIMPLRTD